MYLAGTVCGVMPGAAGRPIRKLLHYPLSHQLRFMGPNGTHSVSPIYRGRWEIGSVLLFGHHIRFCGKETDFLSSTDLQCQAVLTSKWRQVICWFVEIVIVDYFEQHQAEKILVIHLAHLTKNWLKCAICWSTNWTNKLKKECSVYYNV